MRKANKTYVDKTDETIRTPPSLPCLPSMRCSTYPLRKGVSVFHRYEFQIIACHEVRRETQANLARHIEAERMKTLPGFMFGTRERVSYANERERIDIYLRHDDEGGDAPILETVEHFPDTRSSEI